MEAKYVIKWTYTPTNYFEEARDIKGPNYRMWINNGEVRAEVNEDDCSDPYEMLKEIHASLILKFLGYELFYQKPFELSWPTIYKVYPDGSKNYLLQPQDVTIKIEVGSPDLIQYDKNGNILTDARQERINKKPSFIQLVDKYIEIDPIVKKIITAFHDSFHSTKKELVYLFEIWETVSGQLGEEKSVLSLIGLSKKDKRKLTELANNPEIKQGRHSGRQIGADRDATQEEMNDARNITTRIIIGYLMYLESNQPKVTSTNKS